MEEARNTTDTSTRRAPTGEMVIAAAFLLVFLAAGTMSLQFPEGDRLLPALVIGPGIALSVYVGVRLLRGSEGVYGAGDSAERLTTPDLARLLWSAAFFVAVVVLGFTWGSGILAAVYAWRAGERPHIAVLIGASAFLVVLGFENLFALRFPPGLLEGG